MPKLYVLHQAHLHTQGCASSVKTMAYATEDEAILANKKEHRDYYEIDMVYIHDKPLNKLQRFIKKLFRI